MHRNLKGEKTGRDNRTAGFRYRPKSKKRSFGIGNALMIAALIAAAGFFVVERGYAPEWLQRIGNEVIIRKSVLDSDTYESFDTDEETKPTEAPDPEKDTGWVKRENDWFYLDDDHEPLTDQWIDDIYYVGEDGALLRDATAPDGRKVDKNGEVISMTGKAYGAYLDEIKRLEKKYGKTGIVSSPGSGDNDLYKDMVGVCLVKLIDFNRDGLDELLVAYYDMGDRHYHFRVYGYRDDDMKMYVDELMGGNGNPMIYSVGTETLDAGEEYVVTHYGVSKHRIFGFDSEGRFVKLKDIGLRKVDGKDKNDSEVARVTESWLSDNEKNYAMTMLKDYKERIEDITAAKRTLRTGANASKNGSQIEKTPQDYPDKAKEYTTQQLTDTIYEHTSDKIIDYIYSDFNGDGARDMVAMTIRYVHFETEPGLTSAPDEADNPVEFDGGYDYCATWWYTDGKETYSFYDITVPVMTGLRLYSVETESGNHLAATMYWRDSIMSHYTPGEIINNGRTPYVIDAYGTTGRTTSTESTGIIYRFSREEGAVEMFNEYGYSFSVPSRNRIQYEHAVYSIGQDGTTWEDCSYGFLRYNHTSNKWDIF